jgi:hypothetical protein
MFLLQDFAWTSQKIFLLQDFAWTQKNSHKTKLTNHRHPQADRLEIAVLASVKILSVVVLHICQGPLLSYNSQHRFDAFHRPQRVLFEALSEFQERKIVWVVDALEKPRVGLVGYKLEFFWLKWVRVSWGFLWVRNLEFLE